MFATRRLQATLSLLQVKAITLAKMRDRMEGRTEGAMASTVFVDVRSPFEVEESGMIPGAVNIPMERLHEELAGCSDAYFQRTHRMDKALDPRAHRLVMYCRTAVRSEAAVIIAKELDYAAVDWYEGGWQEYTADPITEEDIEAYWRDVPPEA
jgi:3-mercaptopyruvate sulfurtransferase SseA